MEENNYYKFVVFDKYDDLVDHGVLNSSIEVFVEDVFPKCNSCSDRSLSEMQDYADEYLSEHGYKFFYEELYIDFNDLINKNKKKIKFLYSANYCLTDYQNVIYYHE
jgi:hypothetical protein